jgi:diketogulonate reductase-like aldo/keto reductase
MRARRFGPLDVEVPLVGIGTWKMERDDADAAMAAIRRAVELGMTHIDTAEMYGNGIAERLLGIALDGVPRDRLFLVSKVLPGNAGRADTIAACEDSLARLKTDYLDVYLLHWRGEIPLAETFEAFETLRTQGKIRAWGVSNFDIADLEEAFALVGPGKIACNQVLYHLGERTIEHEVIPWAEENGVAVVAYSPFGSTRGFPKSQALALMAQEFAEGTTPRQLALAFLARKAFVIPKSSNVAHVEQCAGAGDIELDEDTLAAIDAAFPLGPWRGLSTI